MIEKKNCSECGKEFELEVAEDVFSQRFSKLVKRCSECGDKAERERQEREREEKAMQRKADWESLCPANFLETNPEKIPNQKAFKTAMGWQYSEKGMVLHGPTGKGKSRTLYKVLEKQFLFGDYEFRVLDHSSALEYAALFSESAAEAWKWCKDKMKTDILAMDDIFKVKLSESFEQAIFTIVSSRTENNMPILLTTQDVGKTIEARMTPDRGPALVRRLRDFCVNISFS